MTVAQFLAYLNDSLALPGDTLIIQNAGGTAMTITAITRNPGTTVVKPPAQPAPASATVTISLAIG